MMKKLLLASGVAIGVIVLLVALAAAITIGYNVYAGIKADRAAKLLCGTIHVGSDIDSVVVAAAQRRDGNQLTIYEGEHHFRFQAGAFNTFDCAVKTDRGRVVSVRVYANDG